MIWDLLTSDLIMALIALIACAALIIGYFPLVKWIPMIGEYAKAAKLAFIILFAFLLFLGGFRVADNRAEMKIVKDQLAARDRDLQLANDAAEKADADRTAATERAKEAHARIDDYAERLKARPNADCLLTDDDFVDRVPNGGKRK